MRNTVHHVLCGIAVYHSAHVLYQWFISAHNVHAVMPEGRDPRREDMEALLVSLDETNKKLQYV